MKQIDLKCLRDILDELIKNGYETNDIDVNVTLDFKDNKCDNEEDREEDKENKITSDDIMQFRDRINDNSVYGAFGSNASNAFKHPLAKRVYLKLQKYLPNLQIFKDESKITYKEDIGVIFNMGTIKLTFLTGNNDMFYFDIILPGKYKMPFRALFNNALDYNTDVPVGIIPNFISSGLIDKSKLFTPYIMFLVSGISDSARKAREEFYATLRGEDTYTAIIYKDFMFLKERNQLNEITNKVARIIYNLRDIISSKDWLLTENMFDVASVSLDQEKDRVVFSYAISIQK